MRLGVQIFSVLAVQILIFCFASWFWFFLVGNTPLTNEQAEVNLSLYVAYFDQHLSAVHSKHWLKYAVSRFSHKKEKDKQEKRGKKISEVPCPNKH